MVSDRPPFAEARAAAAAELARDPANRSACAVLGRCAVLLRRGQEFVQVMDHWATVSGDRGRLCNSVLAGVLNEGGWCDLLVLIEMVPRESPWHILCLYYAGCAAMMLDQRPSALEFFRRFRTTVRYYAEHIAFFEDASLNVALRQGRLVADADEVRRRLAEPVPAPAITWLHDLPAPSDAVVFVACNGLYANLVAEDFVREVDGVRGRYGLHLHVIDPDDQSLAVIDRILTASRNVAITTETQPFARTKTYFSCSRLFVMEQILRHHDRPIVALDIDIALELPIESLLQASDGADFACFTTGRNEPASTYQASIMVWRNSARRSASPMRWGASAGRKSPTPASSPGCSTRRRCFRCCRCRKTRRWCAIATCGPRWESTSTRRCA